MDKGGFQTEAGIRSIALGGLADLADFLNVLGSPGLPPPVAAPIHAPVDPNAAEFVWLDLLDPDSGPAFSPATQLILDERPHTNSGHEHWYFAPDFPGPPESFWFSTDSWETDWRDSAAPDDPSIPPFARFAGNDFSELFAFEAPDGAPTGPGPEPGFAASAVQVTTTASDVPIVTFGEVVHVSDAGGPLPQSNTSNALINVDEFLGADRFMGVDGSGFAAVIIDTGIDLNHPFFGPDLGGDGIADRIVFQYDFADGDGDASDHNGHGSNVSSIVASSDGTYTGVAPGADIISLKVFTDGGSGSFSFVEQALQWVVDNAAAYNIASVNMSLGDGGNYGTAQSLYGISDEIAALAALDVITVSASGNGFYEVNSVQGVQYPAADPNSLSVGAVYESDAGGFSYSGGAQASSSGADVITPFSQRDADLTDVFAPGAPITGADWDGGTVTMHGTSQAAPHVTGLAVLAQELAMEALGRRLTVEEFARLLSDTGVTINDGDDEHDNVDNTGLDFSRVDALALGDAILAMVEPTVFVAITAADAVKTEGDLGTTPFTFTVTRTGDISLATNVSYAVTGNGTDAADAADFGGTLPSGTVSFAAGETEKTLTIDVKSDFDVEPDEGFAVALSQPSLGAAITTASAAATIVNDDDASNQPTVVESRVSSSSDDAEERATGAVSLTSTDLEMVRDKDDQTVGIRFTGIDVPQGAIIARAYLQFQVDETAAGETILTIRGEATNDAVAFSNAALDITSRPVTAASAEWSPPAWNSVGEAGTGQRSADLAAVVQEIVDQGGWSPGNAMAFQISGSGKRVAESFDGDTAGAPLLHIEYVEAQSLAPDPVTFYEIAATDTVQPEGDAGVTSFVFTVTRTGDVSAASDVSYAVAGSGANAADGADFGGALPSGTVSFAAGETSTTLTVDVTGDTAFEPDEGFIVTLSNPGDGGAITTPSAAATIENDDGALSIAATDAVKAEGDAGTTAFTFTVTRTGDASGPVDVAFAVSGSGADSADAADFGGTLPSGTVSFAAGETSKTLTVDASGDTGLEADEGFTVTLSSPSDGSTITTASADGLIRNDDSELAITAADAVKDEGDAGTTAFAFTVTRTGDASGPVDVAFAVTASGADAAEADDFGGALPSGTIGFAAGETSTTLTVDVAGDTAFEADEGFTVTLSTPSDGSSIATASADGTILNDDVPPPSTFVAITATDAVKAEGNLGTTAFVFTITRTGDASIASEVSYAVTGSGANAADAADFGGVLPFGTVSFAAGDTEKTLTLDVSGDFDIEADEGFTVTLSQPSAGSAITTASAEATIQNDDDASSAPTVVETRVSSTTDDAEEAESGSVSLSSTDLEMITEKSHQTVGIRFTGLDVPQGAIIVSAYLQFQTDETDSQATTLAIQAEATDDAATFANTAFDISSRPLTTASATWSPAAWNTVGEAGAAQHTVDLAPVIQEVVDRDGWSANNALALVISGAGKRVAESFDGDTAGAPLLHIEYVEAQSLAPDPVTFYEIAATDTVQAEGDAGPTSFIFTVTRTGDVSGAADVAYAVTGDGTAQADAADFGGALPSGTVSFGAGETSKTMTVEVTGDTDVEADESFTVTLSNPTDGGAIATPGAAGTIINDDSELAIAATDAVKDEGDAGATAFTFTVTRTGDMTGPVDVAYAVTGNDAGAADAADFGGRLPSGAVSLAAGETAKTLTVDVTGDTNDEGDEGFTVTLSDPSDGSTIATASADGLIRNDDAPPPVTFIAIEATDAVKAEGDGGTTPFSFTLTRTGDVSGPAAVSYAVTGSGADEADFGGALPSGFVSFAPNEITKTLTVGVTGDTDFEGDEGFAVTLSDPSSGAAITTASAAATIVNDDLPPAEIVTAEIRVWSGTDDAEEGASGAVSLSSTDLELINDRGDQTVGIRFGGIEVPQGATIVNAYLQFQVDETASVATDLVIRGQATGDTATFSAAAFDISSRPLTSASTAWSPAPWDVVGEAGSAQRTPDLSQVVQEIVDQGDWSAANAMAFVISGSGKRVAESFNGDTAGAPLLHIEYESAPHVPPTTFLAIEATDAAKPEGDDGASPFIFTVTRTGDTSIATDVAYAVTGSGIDAADPNDFGGAMPSGTLDFAAGETSKTIEIDVAGDTRFEADEGFTVTLSHPAAGTAITAGSAVGAIANDDAPSPDPIVVESRVAATSDDAEEQESGSVSLSSSDLELVTEKSVQTVGMRFDGINVPNGATILDAYIQFQVDETDSVATTLEIRGEATGNAATFASTTFDISSRALTSASAAWSPTPWDIVGEAGSAQRTPDLAAIVQEIVGQGDWSAANAMAFVITGAGKRVAESFDGDSTGAPLLHIEFEDPAHATHADYFFSDL